MFKRARIALAIGFVLAALLVLGAQAPPPLPQPSVEQKKLSVFVGTWKDDGEMKASAFAAGGKISISQTCEWFMGGYSVVCHAETTGSTGDRKSINILNYNPDENFYEFYELNSVGRTSLSKCTVDADTWTCNSESNIGGKVLKVRYTIKLSTPDSSTLRAEFSYDSGPWTPTMELKGTRAK